jgi:hypothetical protein
VFIHIGFRKLIMVMLSTFEIADIYIYMYLYYISPTIQPILSITWNYNITIIYMSDHVY